MLWLAATVIALGLSGCGHHHADYSGAVVVYPGSRTFTLTLVNDTPVFLDPGPIVIEPAGVVYDNLPIIPPGGSVQVVFDSEPSSIIVNASGAYGVAYVYPTHTLELGFDYYSDATGVTFGYRH